MDAYVKVGNDLQLAVKYIILSKKAFLKQSRCISVLNRDNTLLQQKVNDLQMHNKELRALSLLAKQNQSLKKEMSELENKLQTNREREHVLNEILACDTFVPSEITTSTEDSTTSSDVNSTGDEEDVLARPLSPIKRKSMSTENNTTSSDINSTGDEEDVVAHPLSPTKKKKNHNQQYTPKKKGQQKNKSQPDSGAAVQEKTAVLVPRRSSRVRKHNNDK